MRFYLLIFGISLLFKSVAQAPDVTNTGINISLSATILNYENWDEVLKLKKLEIGIRLPFGESRRINNFLHFEGVYNDELNPFLEWEVDVEAIFRHEGSGFEKIIDGYYHREYIENPVTHDWDDIGTIHPFRIRFAPPHIGKWSARIQLKIKGELIETTDEIHFSVIESGSPGYVTVHPNKKNLVRDNKIIFPVGHNFIGADENHILAWGGGSEFSLGNRLFNPGYPTTATNTLEWDHYLEKLESYFKKGGKYIRTIQSPWVSLIEFEKKGNYYDRLHYAWEQDKLLDLCEKYDVLMMFNLMMHIPFTICDPYLFFAFDWDHYRKHGSTDPYFYDNSHLYPAYCYNDTPAEFGGKLPHEALSNDDDLLYHQQRTRYYISRYGYSTSIYEFELLSEPFNVNVDVRTNSHPYFNHGSKEQQKVFEAIEKYQNNLAEYIKTTLQHTNHLIGVDYAMDWRPYPSEIHFDKSMFGKHIDIVGFNYYAFTPNKYIISKSGSNNEFHSSENSRARAFKELQELVDKPIILSEFGDGDNVVTCSKFTGNYIDAMSMGFTGVCGFQLWEGKDSYEDTTWKATINAQNHMNSDEIIKILSAKDGKWAQGRQVGLLKRKAIIEHQYYLSNDGSNAAGYVRNRSFNFYTQRDTVKCGNYYISKNYFAESPIDQLMDIKWNNLRGKNRLRVEGLKKKTTYEVTWYSYKSGNIMTEFTQCQTTSKNNLVLKFPPLITTDHTKENPLVWYVIAEKLCK